MFGQISNWMDSSLKLILFSSILVFELGCSNSPKIIPNSATLEQEINALVKDFHGDVGVYVKHLGTGQEISFNSDMLFPTASMIKVPILLALFDKIERTELNYDSTLIWTPEMANYPAGGLLSSFKDSSTISLTKLISLMITYSDNHASLWCQELADGGIAINEWLASHKFEKTRMNSRTPGRQENWKQFGWGQTSPREMAELLTMIHTGEELSPWACEEMYRYLTRIYWDDEALSQIPRTIQVASKQGAVNDSRSEVVLVNAPGGDYVFCIITNNQEDQSWDEENEGYTLIRQVSQLLWSVYQ